MLTITMEKEERPKKTAVTSLATFGLPCKNLANFLVNEIVDGEVRLRKEGDDDVGASWPTVTQCSGASLSGLGDSFRGKLSRAIT